MSWLSPVDESIPSLTISSNLGLFFCEYIGPYFAVACAWLGTTFIHAWFFPDNNFAGFRGKTADTDLDINAQNPVRMT
jgi:hypothetical protein